MTAIDKPNISDAWLEAAKHLSERGLDELVPLVVRFTGLGNTAIDENPNIRNALDAYLDGAGLQSIETVANTIFPIALWNRDEARATLFARYLKILPRLKRASGLNRRGLYFERMVTGGPVDEPNQLDFAIGEYTSRSGVRRSALQVATFQPTLDHSHSARLGFPCLQHVLFTPVAAELHVCAFYATQYLVEKAYGNYLGLARLGQFVAHELKKELKSVTCVAGIGELDVSKTDVRDLVAKCTSAATTE